MLSTRSWNTCGSLLRNYLDVRELLGYCFLRGIFYIDAHSTDSTMRRSVLCALECVCFNGKSLKWCQDHWISSDVKTGVLPKVATISSALANGQGCHIACFHWHPGSSLAQEKKFPFCRRKVHLYKWLSMLEHRWIWERKVKTNSVSGHQKAGPGDPS